jgi:hypothetical protein
MEPPFATNYALAHFSFPRSYRLAETIRMRSMKSGSIRHRKSRAVKDAAQSSFA